MVQTPSGPVLIGKADAFNEFARGIKTLKSSVRPKAKRFAKLARFAKNPSPWFIGFTAGWELGSMIWGDPFALEGEQSSDPEYWSSPSWTWFPCAEGAAAAGPTKYWILSGGGWGLTTCGQSDTIGQGQIDDGYATPEEAAQNITTHVPVIHGMNIGDPESDLVRKLGEYAWTSGDRNAAWEYSGPLEAPAIVASPLPAPRPEWGPEALPIMRPVANPIPKAWEDAVADPATQPAQDPARFPRRGTSRVPNPRPPVVDLPLSPFPVTILPGTVPDPFTGEPVVVQPPTVVVQPSPVPGRPPTISTPPGRPHRRPPRGKVKERKVNVRSVAGAAWVGVNLFTEGLDFIGVLWDSLDPSVQTPLWTRNADGSWNRRDINDQLRDIYNHWDEIDLGALLENFVNNQVEDMFYGQLGRVGSGLNRLTGAPTGGPGAIRRAGSEAEVEGTPIPELVYDRETGEWSIEWRIVGAEASLGGGERPGEIGRLTGY